MYNLMGVATGTLDNFIIFRNGGGKPFDILVVKKDEFMDLVNRFKGYSYAYKKDGVEVILRNLYQ